MQTIYVRKCISSFAATFAVLSYSEVREARVTRHDASSHFTVKPMKKTHNKLIMNNIELILCHPLIKA